MGAIKYLFHRISKMNKRGMIDKAADIAKKTNRTKAGVFLDMVWCGFRYGAGYLDYDLFEMYNLNAKQRDTVLTRARNAAIIRKHNDTSYNWIFIQKNAFNSHFADFMKRDWIEVREDNRDEVEAFYKRHDIVYVKPRDGSCGKGIERLNTAEHDFDEVYKHALETNKIVFEERIIQHPLVSAIYPTAINTVRVVTLLRADGKVAIPFAYFRIGAGGRFVDNFNSQGMVAPVDAATGIVLDRAIDKKKNLYVTHPDTGATIKGFQFPYWDEILSMCRKAAHVVPEMGYVGWDVGITPDGPLLVEANEYPGHDIYQLPEHTPNKIGVYPQYKNAVYL